MKASRELVDIISKPEKGDYVELGDIKMTVKKVDDKGVNIRFVGENGVTKNHKGIRVALWADMVTYLSKQAEGGME